MLLPRYGHALVFHKNMVFAVGGQDSMQILDSVEVFHTRKDYWEELEPISKPRAYAHGCTIGDMIYVFSSIEENNALVSDVSFEVLDASMIYNSWKTISIK